MARKGKTGARKVVEGADRCRTENVEKQEVVDCATFDESRGTKEQKGEEKRDEESTVKKTKVKEKKKEGSKLKNGGKKGGRSGNQSAEEYNGKEDENEGLGEREGSELEKQKRAAVEEERRDCIEIQITESDCLLGMRKWLSEYHNKRPGFQVLQQQIDDFITNFDALEEKARQEREAAAAEDGWTVVEHQKGRKKTVDLESGISVGGVSLAAVQRKQKKQMKDSALNFYRFQRREARRNEILELQQRFEEDKRKIATLRAARKFRPY